MRNLEMLMSVVGALVVMVTAGGNGSEFLPCDVENIPIIHNYDASNASGLYFVKYRLQEPSYIKELNVRSTAIHQRFQMHDNGPHLHVNQSFVMGPGQGQCVNFPLTLKLEDSVATGEIERLPMHEGRLTQTIAYLLGTDDINTFAVFYLLKIDGEVSPQDSVLNILLKDPSKGVNMDVIRDNVVKFCGQRAGSLNSYTEYTVYPDKHQNCIQAY